MIGKNILPKSLFGRALLILVLPTVLIQLVTAYVFFDRHWNTISRHRAADLAGEIAFLLTQMEEGNPHHRYDIAERFSAALKIQVVFESIDRFKPASGNSLFPEFEDQLRRHIQHPFRVERVGSSDNIRIDIRLHDVMVQLTASIKRLESPTTMIYMSWVVGTSVLFLMIAVLFLRNQVRPIHRLAEAADQFGRGMEMPDFKPHGAIEVRKAARAFIIMRERIKRQLKTRTDMLSGISHDLRTPLTRMKLQLAMIKEEDAARELRDDVQQMEHMIQEYLDFARGEGGEEPVSQNLRTLLAEVVGDYQRTGAAVSLVGGIDDVTLNVRASAFRRMLHNIIDNALRYGKHCEVGLRKTVNYCEILIDDDGPGIPEHQREDVFRPFTRLEPSRNTQTGGVGLGLTIARDIILAHGGVISLDGSPRKGLRVIIRLPL